MSALLFLRRRLGATLLFSLAGSGWARAQAPSPAVELFETSVRPLLAQRCYSCHGPDKQFGGLRTDSLASLLRGGKSGPALAPGDAERSLLMRAVRGEALRMPMGGELSATEIHALGEWIERGAPWPANSLSAGGEGDRYVQLVREHWAFQPVGRPTPPEVSEPRWQVHPVDRFLFSALRVNELEPAPPASREVLIRRVSYALTGLPPSLADVEAFTADKSPDAYARLVERYLDSPLFGERWARHWLDLVRYAETRGYEWNYEIVGAWRYRDYVVRALNQDVPYDQLVREHIAGDLLEKPRLDAAGKTNESVIGTAFYRLGEAGHDDCVMFREIALDVVDNEIDVLSKTFQGLTVACARCHDHKLDPIPTTDYYGLYSILNSSRVATHTIDTAEARREQLQELRTLKPQIRAAAAAVWSRDVATLAQRLARKAEPEAEMPMEDPEYLIRAVRGLQREGVAFRDAYEKVAGELRKERLAREAVNRESFTSFGNFREKTPHGWTADGLALAGKPSKSGDFAIETSGDAAIRGIYPAGRYTHTFSARLNGAVRSPLLPKGPKKLSLRVVGGMLGARRTVIDNCAIGEDYAFLDSAAPKWITIDLAEKWGDLPVFVELVTRWDNPRIPDRPDRIKEPHLSLMDSPESYFGIVEAVLHDGDDAPRADLGHLSPLLDDPAPASEEELFTRYQVSASAAVELWSRGEATDEDVVWLSWLIESKLLSNEKDASSELARLIKRYREVDASLPEPRLVEGLADAGDGRDFPVLIGGGPTSPGEPAPRRFLARLYGEEPLTRSGSGRRELAELLASEDNPLTARVMVNRIWSYLFGRGIVASVDNFGSLGDEPSNPELLDYLARKFMDDGWSIKGMIRFLVLSQAFQQSGSASVAGMERDPQNALLHHFSVRRLSAEEIRDTLLSVAGELQPRTEGPSVQPYRKQPKDYRRLFSGPLLGDGRRSLYLKVTRMEGPAFLETFDFPLPATTRGNRDVTTVPAQSLALLNDPFALSIAQRCAERVLASPASSTAERIEALFRAILVRSPDADEAERFAVLADRLETLRPADDAQGELEAWRDLAHVLLNTKELLYVE